MIELNITLSDKPSEMILQALADLEKIEKASDTYTIDMWTWHDARYGDDDAKDKTCHVCFAGAVLACAGLPADESVTPSDFVGQPKLRSQLNALDCFRCGEMHDALSTMGIPCPEELEYTFDVTDYECDRTQFKEDMRRLAGELAEHGL